MNPHQKNKVDVSSLSPEEQRLFRLYGKLPSKSDHFAKHLKDRKYFDSGDYAMSKAGKGDSVDTGSVGSQHPVPENIPHLSSPSHSTGAGGLNGGPGHQHHHSMSAQGGAAAQPGIQALQGAVAAGAGAAAGSPVKESSFLHREESAVSDGSAVEKESLDTPQQGIPIRR
ncbi:Uu.00g107030.m01.CDS01 [Anthostomella pinea]|uniref:mRNA stability protein n=1 Tax=Anthostomella pinea TaxID=933095 RepID=A0AAI8VEY5_9PEZI|nr:Uu.00g107030.m01.CDS01 [Anthostomella pinea]